MKKYSRAKAAEQPHRHRRGKHDAWKIKPRSTVRLYRYAVIMPIRNCQMRNTWAAPLPIMEKNATVKISRVR